MKTADGVTQDWYEDESFTSGILTTTQFVDTAQATSPPWYTVLYVVPVLAILAFILIWLSCCKSRKLRFITKSVRSYGSTEPDYSASSPSSHKKELNPLMQRDQAVQVVFSHTKETAFTDPFLQSKSLQASHCRKNHCEQTTSTEKLLTSDGLKFCCGQYELEFPPGAVDTSQLITVSVEPSFEFEREDKKLFPIAPILRCEPSGLKFNKKFKVTLHSSYSSQKSTNPVNVFVYVRQSPEFPMQLESCSKLKCDGFTSFYADHFSDREPTVDSRDSSNLNRAFNSFGFMKVVDSDARDITWYLLDKHDNNYQQIHSLHSREEVSVPFLSFLIGANQSLLLKLRSVENDVHFDQEQVSINLGSMQETTSKRYKFLITKSSTANPIRSIIKYSIAKIEVNSTIDESAAHLVTNDGDSFCIGWSHKNSDSQTSIYLGDIIHNVSQNTDSPSYHTFPRQGHHGCVSPMENSLAQQGRSNINETGTRSHSALFSAQSEWIAGRPASRAPFSPAVSSVDMPSNQSQDLRWSSSSSVFRAWTNSETEGMFQVIHDQSALSAHQSTSSSGYSSPAHNEQRRSVAQLRQVYERC